MVLETLTTWATSSFKYLNLQISLNTMVAYAIFLGLFRNVLHLILAAALYNVRDLF